MRMRMAPLALLCQPSRLSGVFPRALLSPSPPAAGGSPKLLQIENFKAHQGRPITGSFQGFAVITGTNGSGNRTRYLEALTRDPNPATPESFLFAGGSSLAFGYVVTRNGGGP